ncbi:MAG: PaaI family thioesterase [Gammaproteobacteria bacterium]|nr:PaaI family thioesterase [Gammaproteobacteria bacterium]
MQKHFTARNPDFRKQVEKSFAAQGFMRLLGARLTALEAGFCEIHLPYREELTQQHGYFHGGVVATLADNAGGYAGASLMADDCAVLTVEFKVNLLAPAQGDKLLARGRVVKSGRTLTITHTDVFAMREETEILCATSLQTLMFLQGRPDVVSDKADVQ